MAFKRDQDQVREEVRLVFDVDRGLSEGNQRVWAG
jgi:hypothetical protein